MKSIKLLSKADRQKMKQQMKNDYGGSEDDKRFCQEMVLTLPPTRKKLLIREATCKEDPTHKMKVAVRPALICSYTDCSKQYLYPTALVIHFIRVHNYNQIDAKHATLAIEAKGNFIQVQNIVSPELKVSSLLEEEHLEDDTTVTYNVHLYILDTETNGFQGSITELFVKCVTEGKDMGSLVSLPKCETLLPEAVNITGITEDMLKNAPNFCTVAQDLLDFANEIQESMNDIHIFIAHNMTRFDAPKLKSHFHDVQISIPSNWHFVDSIHYCHYMAPVLRNKGTFSLKSLIKTFCPSTEFVGHRAESDCIALYQVLTSITENVYGQSVDVNEKVADFFMGYVTKAIEFTPLPEFPHKFSELPN
eukprot:Pompholyxophrys_punicea_v1_NODE_179_length_2990_cov_78.650085.p2 type:complete len:363 gc:universal NODE_179_length_2990_cov_78.650085:1451-363(-)